jgi:hypothetical protein
MVVIVACARFVKHWTAVDYKPSQETRFGEMRQTIIDSLVRHFWQEHSNVCQDRGGTCVGPKCHRIENGNALPRHAEARVTD